LFKADLLAPITVNIIPGARTAVATFSVAHMLAPGVIFRVGDQDLTVSAIDNTGTTITFFPYKTNGATNDYVYVSETLLGIATTTGTSFSAGSVASIIQANLDGAVRANSYVQFQCANENEGIVKDILNDQVVSWTSTELTVNGNAHTLTCAANSAGNKVMAVYRQHSKIVRFDATQEEIKKAVTEMAAVGAVEVSRFGPDSNMGFTWSVTFTSAKGTTKTCTGLPRSECLQTSNYSPLVVTISGGSGTTLSLNGDYIANGMRNGRPTYFQKNPLCDFIFRNSSSWKLGCSHCY